MEEVSSREEASGRRAHSRSGDLRGQAGARGGGRSLASLQIPCPTDLGARRTDPAVATLDKVSPWAQWVNHPCPAGGLQIRYTLQRPREDGSTGAKHPEGGKEWAGPPVPLGTAYHLWAPPTPCSFSFPNQWGTKKTKAWSTCCIPPSRTRRDLGLEWPPTASHKFPKALSTGKVPAKQPSCSGIYTQSCWLLSSGS